jgi:hypothetical protein
VAVPPDGRLIFVGTLMLAHDNKLTQEETNQLLDGAIQYNFRRTKVISVVTAPARWAETAMWYIVDWKRD